jgi:hypothetical protein
MTAEIRRTFLGDAKWLGMGRAAMLTKPGGLEELPLR